MLSGTRGVHRDLHRQPYQSKCDKLAAELAPKTATKITTAQVDADKVDEVIALIKLISRPRDEHCPALSGPDHHGCLPACGVNYMDTANYEPENTDDPEWRAIYEKRCKEAGFSAYFDYSWQWAYAKKFEEAGLTALLGSGFDPGVTQLTAPTPKSTSSTPLTPLIFWTATAATTAMPLPPT